MKRAAAGEEGPFGPAWGMEEDGDGEEDADVAVDAYSAYVAHLECCGECGAVRCEAGQTLVEVYLREVRRRR